MYRLNDGKKRGDDATVITAIAKVVRFRNKETYLTHAKKLQDACNNTEEFNTVLHEDMWYTWLGTYEIALMNNWEAPYVGDVERLPK